MDWYNVYLEQIKKSGGNNAYMEFKIRHKKKLINIIKKYSNNGKIIEAGCGTGIITSHLANIGFNATGIDVNDNILELARTLEKNFYGNNKAKFINKSIFELDYPKNSFDLCFSCGVLEHFEDDKIVLSINQQLNIANTVIIVIPTKWFDDNEALHGDDRFLKLSYWRNLIAKANGNILSEYSYPFRQNIKQKLLNLKKLFRPKAYRIFVVNSK